MRIMRSDAAKIFLNAIVPGIFNIKINRAKILKVITCIKLGLNTLLIENY